MGTCFWNCVGRCSQIHNDDEDGTDFSWKQFAFGYIRQQCRSSNSFCFNGVILPKTLERIRPCQLEMERAQMMTGCKSTLSRKARGRAKANTTIQKGSRTTSTTNTSSTDINTCKYCGRTGHWAKDCWRPGGAHDNSTNDNSNTQKGKSHKSHKKRKGKSKQVDVEETNQPSQIASTVSCPSQTPRTIGELSCNSNMEPWITGVTINSVSSTKRQGGAEYLLLDSGAQLSRMSDRSVQTKKVLLLDPGIHTASGARLQHDGGRLVT